MKNLYIILLSLFLFSCQNEPVDFTPVIDHQKALDTLKKYSDYILGDFNGKLLISTNAFSKSYGASIVSLPIDSSHIQFQIGYKLKNNDIEKSAFVTYRFLESKTKLDPNHYYRYTNFTDFVDFFKKNKFNYFQNNKPIEKVHNVYLIYQNYYEINNELNGYNTHNYTKPITSDNFNFTIDSIKAIETPTKKVEVYYSFKCIGLNSFKEELKMKNGKGKSTFEYNQ